MWMGAEFRLPPCSLLTESKVNCLNPETFMKQIYQTHEFYYQFTRPDFVVFSSTVCFKPEASTNED